MGNSPFGRFEKRDTTKLRSAGANLHEKKEFDIRT